MVALSQDAASYSQSALDKDTRGLRMASIAVVGLWNRHADQTRQMMKFISMDPLLVYRNNPDT